MNFMYFAQLRNVFSIIILAGIIASTGCSQNQTSGAAKGATTGAIAGAAGSMMVALVFGGDVGEAAARGAVYGGTAGAVTGTISGTAKDNAEAEQLARERQKEIEKFREEIGSDAFAGVQALVQCKYEVAAAYGKTASRSANPDYALAGTWLQALTLQDQGNAEDATAILDEIITRDPRVSKQAEVLSALNAYQTSLETLRQELELPAKCSS